MRLLARGVLIALLVGSWVLIPASLFAQGLTIDTVAGDTTLLVNGGVPPPGFSGDGGPAVGAKLNQPNGVVVDSAGNIYISDTLNQRIRKVTKATGIITTIAGTGTGGYNGDNIQATTAQLNGPSGLAIDAAGNLFVADLLNSRIRKIAPNGIITTVVGTEENRFYSGEGGLATLAQICYPYSVVLDGSNNLYFSDTGNHAVRKVAAATQIITTVAGTGVALCGQAGAFAGDNGPATAAKLNSPLGIAVNAAGTNLYIADVFNNRIRRVSGGVITTVAGSGPVSATTTGDCPTSNYTGENIAATSAPLDWPWSVAVDSTGNLFIADYCNYRIRKVASGTQLMTTVAGNGLSGYDGDGGSSTVANISDPTDVRVDSAGNFYIVDQSSNRIRKVFPSTPPVITLHPTDQFTIPGGSPTFAVNASGAPAPTVVWQVSTNGGASFSNIPGQTGLTYSFVATLADTGKRYRAVFTNAFGGATTISALLTVRLPTGPTTDFDRDGAGDLTVYRPGSGTWFTLTSSNGYNYANAAARQWGNQALGDVPFIGDIDGDALADLIVWRASTGTWYWLTSSSGYSLAAAGGKLWGNQSLGDVPMLADIDGDRRSDLVVWRASTGTWYWVTSSSGYVAFGGKQWGNQAYGDVPKLADVDGDGKADLMLWRASTGEWYWLTSSSGYNYANFGGKLWGNSGLGDVPLVGDLDGDGKTELIVWRASNGTWYWLQSTTAYATANAIQWGNQAFGDVPLLTDLDGDGKADLTVFRVPSGTWYWLKSLQGYSYATAGAKVWGSQPYGDIPMVK